MARIVRPWGRTGAVIAELETDDVSGLVGGGPLTLGAPGAGGEKIRVTEARAHGRGRVVLRIEGIESIDEAETLRGASLSRPRGRVAPAPEGTYYAFQLLGLRAVTVAGEELGRVEEIRETGGADLLVVRGGGRERLIPFARAICPRVDPEAGILVVDAPEGLLELDEV